MSNNTRIRSFGNAPEVVSYQLTNFSDAPQFVHQSPDVRTYAKSPQWSPDHTPKSNCLTLSEEAAGESGSISNDQPASRRRRILVILAVLGVVLLITVVTVVGVFASKKSESPAASASTAIQAKSSRLAVTGYRYSGGGGFFYRLYYQTQSRAPGFIEYAGESSSWRGPFNISGTNAAAMTGMAASMVMTADPPQWEYFWRDANNKIKGRNWKKPLPQQVNGLEDSINNFPILMSPTSSIAAYWPYLATQDDSTDNALRITTYIGGGTGASPWVNSTTGTAGAQVAAASKGSALAIVPRVATYSRPWDAGLVYRTVDGRLAGVSMSWGTNSTWEPWSIAGIPIPETSRIAAFAVGNNTTSSGGSSSNNNNNNNGGSVSTCILYQQASGAIYYVTYSDQQWSQPATHAVFADADENTDITCLTESLWTPDGDAVLTLSSETDMSRCFFFVKGGGIREVLFNGSSWSVVGLVPT